MGEGCAWRPVGKPTPSDSERETTRAKQWRAQDRGSCPEGETAAWALPWGWAGSGLESPCDKSETCSDKPGAPPLTPLVRGKAFALFVWANAALFFSD